MPSGDPWAEYLSRLGYDVNDAQAGDVLRRRGGGNTPLRQSVSPLARAQRKQRMKKAVRLWIPLWEAFGDGTPYKTEQRFHPQRRWRADVLFPTERLIVEFEGMGGEMGHEGRHRSFMGAWYDMRKYNAAQELGYVVYRVAVPALQRGLRDQNGELITPQQVVAEVVRLLEKRREEVQK